MYDQEMSRITDNHRRAKSPRRSYFNTACIPATSQCYLVISCPEPSNRHHTALPHPAPAAFHRIRRDMTRLCGLKWAQVGSNPLHTLDFGSIWYFDEAHAAEITSSGLEWRQLGASYDDSAIGTVLWIMRRGPASSQDVIDIHRCRCLRSRIPAVLVWRLPIQSIFLHVSVYHLLICFVSIWVKIRAIDCGDTIHREIG